ncbi:MAG TPA: asparaginase [Thermotogota bacterium]|nr:asparaginase [Thermotogota bacterium]HPJ87951.1 asparaginase [Thermotogota bacterium]HPR95038.1 asparaginase [Thermotogota bacterium]
MNKKVIIVTTGGTIAMRKETEGVIPSNVGNSKIAELNGLERFANIETIDFCNIPSPYMTPEIMFELSCVVQELVDREDVTGVVITHGTDTLEETSYMLDLTVDTIKPIVVTAAMRNINELGTDGPRNVFSSVEVAASDYSRGCGTVVCLNDEIHAAREVTKTYTSNVATFDSPGFGPLGIVDDDGVFFFRKSLRRTYIKTSRVESKTCLIKTFPGDKGEFLDYAVKNGTKGIVLEGFGRGNVPPELTDPIQHCLDKGVPIVLVSRCYKGRVLDIYGYRGGGAALKRLGVILGHEQSSQKARIKLMVLLGCGMSIDEIRESFEISTYVPERRDF